jgi:hypothetical protein
MKQIVEFLWSYSEALLRKVGLKVQESPRQSTIRRGRKLFQAERRREIRSPRISPCTYGLMPSMNRNGARLEGGHGTAVNDSLTGMRLLLGVAPSKGQLLEIQGGHSTLEQTIRLVEVCWTKPLREDSEEVLYLVGCRLNADSRHSESLHYAERSG